MYERLFPIVGREVPVTHLGDRSVQSTRALSHPVSERLKELGSVAKDGTV